jgi:hypothetical protein
VERAVEVAVLNRGRLETVRILSLRRERLGAGLGALAGAALVLAGMGTAMLWLATVDRVVHGPTFIASWAAAALTVGIIGARWARARFGRYRIGLDAEADTFAATELDLVRRAGGDYELGLVPGMVGVLEGGRAPMPVEALTMRGPIRVPLPRDGQVRVEMGGVTFVIARKREDVISLRGLLERFLSAGYAGVRRVARSASLGVAAAATLTALMAVPQVQEVSEASLHTTLTRFQGGVRFIQLRLEMGGVPTLDLGPLALAPDVAGPRRFGVRPALDGRGCTLFAPSFEGGSERSAAPPGHGRHVVVFSEADLIEGAPRQAPASEDRN